MRQFLKDSVLKSIRKEHGEVTEELKKGKRLCRSRLFDLLEHMHEVLTSASSWEDQIPKQLKNKLKIKGGGRHGTKHKD